MFTFERRGEKFIKLNLFPQSSVTGHCVITISSLHLILSSWTSVKPKMRLLQEASTLSYITSKISLQLPEPAAYLESQFNSVNIQRSHPSAFDPGSKTLFGISQYKLTSFQKTEAKTKENSPVSNDTDVAFRLNEGYLCRTFGPAQKLCEHTRSMTDGFGQDQVSRTIG